MEKRYTSQRQSHCAVAKQPLRTMQFLRILCNEDTVQIRGWGNDQI